MTFSNLLTQTYEIICCNFKKKEREKQQKEWLLFERLSNKPACFYHAEGDCYKLQTIYKQAFKQSDLWGM